VKIGLILVLSAFAIANAAAALSAEPSAGRIVYYTSYKCPPPADASEPGATPENAIAPEVFDDPAQDEQVALMDSSGKTQPRFSCKWVRLTGFFVPSSYYHYRGKFYENAWEHYRTTAGLYNYYLLESFRDPAMRRAAIGHRRVTIVGRFYYLCATAPGGDDVLMLLGPCHYGPASGMMLADVIVEKIEDSAPIYLLGERNRAIVGRLPQVESDKRALLTQRIRDWAVAVKRGPEAYATQVLAEDRTLASFQDAERRMVHDDLASADSYVSYLSALPAFKQLNVTRAPVAVFWDGIGSAREAVGCICLKASCTNEWPLTPSDAQNFYGHAACTKLAEDKGVWNWR